MGYRPVSSHEYVDPSQLEDIKIDSDQLILKQEIGRGSFGQVFKGTWRGTEVAIKRIPSNCIKDSETREFMKEAFILRQLRHPNVLQVLGASMEPACIVTEYLPRGNLFQLIHDTNLPLPWPMIRKIALDICRGMSYLHGCTPPLIHRDLKPHNLLVDENWRVKVCDFGLSRFVENKNAMTACGTPAYAAPEVLRNSDYSMSADVYSFGIVLWELVTRDVLYPNMPPFQIIFAVGTQKSRPPMPHHIPVALACLIRECWDEDPNSRPSFLRITERLLEMGDTLY
jgi:serine/threonine protein kinase